MRELVFYGGRPVVGFGDVWPSDLLAYRQEWEPFIAAHVAIWRRLNAIFEGTAAAQQCPAGILDQTTLNARVPPAMQGFCWSLMLTRMRVDQTNPTYGIPAQWNYWAGKSSSDIVAAAATMLKQQQDVVARVAGPYKDELVQLAKHWDLPVELPDVPSFDTQQSIIAQIEGAYVAAKGVLQIAGYAAGQTLVWAGDQAKAVAEGLTDTVKQVPTVVSKLPWIVAGLAVVVGGVVLLVYGPKSRAAAATGTRGLVPERRA